MGMRKLHCVLLLLLFVCFSSEEALMKKLGKNPDVTRICSKMTLNIITLIVCKISTERSRGEECRLLYHYDEGFFHECDSRFTLITENHTVFLKLTNLTPQDTGNYTCECIYRSGMYFLHLSVTVEGEEEQSSSSKTPVLVYLICAVVVIIKIGSSLALSYQMKK